MKHTILTLSCCLILLVPIERAAQTPTATNLPLYYHWISSEELILWKSMDDHPLTVRGQGQKWSIGETEMDTWRPVLEQIAIAYRLSEVGTVSDEVLLWYVVAKISNEPSGKIVQPRDPDVTVYLEPSDLKARVAFIDGTVPRQATVFANFAETGSGWNKAEPVNLPAIFNVADDPAQLARIFSLESVPRTPDQNQQWKLTWESWLVKFRNQDQPARNFYYFDQDNKPRWVWQERLNDGKPIDDGPRLSVGGPEIKEPDAKTIRSSRTETSAWGFGWGFGSGFAAGALLVILIVAVYVAYAWWSRKHAKPVEVQPPAAVDVDTPTATAVDAATLEALHKTAHERWRKRVIELPAPLREMLNSAFEWVGKEYFEAAKAHNLLNDAAAQQETILDGYRKKVLKLPAQTGDETVKAWVQLGMLTEKAIEEVRKALPDETQSFLAQNAAMSSWTEEHWATRWPGLLSKFNSALKQANNDRESVRIQLTEIEQRHKQDLQQKQESTKAEWEDKLAASQNKFASASSQLRDRESDLQTAREKILDLEGANQTVTTQLAGAVSAREEESKTRAELVNKMNELSEVKYLSLNLRRWLQSFSTIAHRIDSNALAPLAALLNFSLFQMCIGIIDGTPDLKRALASNVFVVYQKFVEAAGAPGLSQVLECLDKVAPGIESFELEEKERGGVSLDDDLLRTLLYQLKSATGQNVSPFYTDIDSNSKTLVFVSTS